MKKFATVEDYIKSAPPDIREKLNMLRKLILSVAPEASEKISYGMPYYAYKGRFAYFAYFKDHISFFAMNGVLADFKEEVKKYKTGAATLRFEFDKKLPMPLIKKLLKATKTKNEGK